MKIKLLTLLFLILPLLSNSQEYVDLINVNYGESGNTSFENSSENTTISTFRASTLFPLVLNDKYAVITGADFNKQSLQLFPNTEYNHLYTTRLKLGMKVKYSEHWSTTYVFLPKLASDYTNIDKNDFYLGGAVVFKYKKSNTLNYRFGLYSSTEAFGLYFSPLIGIYYKSPNSLFELNVSFPGDFDVNYSIAKNTKIGIDYFGNSESFRLSKEKLNPNYVQNNSLEFSSYIQNNSINKNLLLRFKLGFSNNNYEVYPVNQKIDLGISSLRFGDDRTQMNSNLSNSLFFKVEAIYRFYIVPN
ncbi:DUF6268 family outer membrane beta-barrel protein [Flavobacterium sp. WC2421]|uniref:DUF6268 family outer membrane beta-barrel protein n=1 Tax=Flavobacterium sp. WC2421 TaxID=3234138 RepID=UPI0034652EB7